MNRVPTHPGKREKPMNFITHAPGWEMSLKSETTKKRDLPLKFLDRKSIDYPLLIVDLSILPSFGP